MAFYEHVFMVRPDVSEAQIESLTKDYTKIVTDGGGKVATHEYWGLKNLAYRIKKNRKAHYVFLALETPYPAVAELERKQRLDENVLRFLTVRVEQLEQGPSAMMRSRSSDELEQLDGEVGEIA